MWRYSAPALLALLLAGCTQYPSGGNIRLHMDMNDQPSYRPQRDPRPLPEGSIARAAEQGPPDAARGQKLYGIYCTPCHGPRGKGDGPVAAKITKPADLTAEKYRKAEDTLFFEAIRNGSGLMPPQAESMSPEESRDVVR